MNTLRNSRWFKVSTTALLMKPEVHGIVRMLGKIDVELHEKDIVYCALRSDIASISSDQWENIHDSIALSHLWILGAYELVRTLSQSLDPATTLPQEVTDKCRQLKHEFERIRMPLAKLETPKYHHTTDYGVAYAGFNETHGLGWMVSGNDFISRDQLGIGMLEFLEFARTKQKAP
jgi:hypothetical protein